MASICIFWYYYYYYYCYYYYYYYYYNYYYYYYYYYYCSRSTVVLELTLQRFIIVETNLAVYAYSHSRLRVALLALFTEMVLGPSAPS